MNGFFKFGLMMLGLLASSLTAAPFASLPPISSQPGYLARLLINETPFPGEKGYISVKNTQAAMVQILWVLHGRIHHIPNGYRQEHIAAIRTTNIFDVITAGGVRGQCDGFFRDNREGLAAVPRVDERIQYLLQIANSGGRPGKFSELVNFAQGLASRYIDGGIREADRFAGIYQIRNTFVTGKGYSWMTDRDYYSPGGKFIKIPNEMSGSLGGNRFFTLEKL